MDPQGCCWLIEAKDYTRGHATTTAAVADDVAQKVRDTLAGLAAARVHAVGDEKRHASEALSTARLRVIFHMELPPPASPQFAATLDQAAVLQQLRQRVRVIDPKLEVVDSGRINHLPWTVV